MFKAVAGKYFSVASIGKVSNRGRLLCFLSLFCMASMPVFAANTVSSARVWPAEDYTRLTLESNAPIQHKLFTIKNPERLVLDLEDVDINKVLEELAPKVSASDPYIKLVRVGRFKLALCAWCWT